DRRDRRDGSPRGSRGTRVAQGGLEVGIPTRSARIRSPFALFTCPCAIRRRKTRPARPARPRCRQIALLELPVRKRDRPDARDDDAAELHYLSYVRLRTAHDRPTRRLVPTSMDNRIGGGRPRIPR